MRRAARSRSSPKKFYPVFSLYLRARFVYSLPLVESFLGVPGLRWLVLWSYSTSARLGAESHVFGLIDDPDLTDIGSGAIIGHGSTLVAHSLTTNPDGTKVMVTAPIVIGPRSVIGGGSLISLGASIGADSVVEPLSSVTAYTKIPPGEVWGGNPAVFRRKRIESCSSSRPVEQPPTFAPAARSDLERQVCSAVASALNLPPQMVTPTFSNRDHSGWDSLGQLAIASELHSFPGCEIPADRCFQLWSVSEIVAYLAAHSQIVADATPAGQSNPSLPSNPELLPLLDHRVATRLLAQSDPGDSSLSNSRPLREIRVVVAATFSTEPLQATLKLWSHAFGIRVRFESAGFDQVPQALLFSESPFRRNLSGINVVLTRPEDLLSVEGDRSEPLLSAIAQFAAEFPGLLVVANLPSVVSRNFEADRDQVGRLRNQWQLRISVIEGIQRLDFADIIERVGTVGAANVDGDRIGRIPYSADVYSELGIALARQVRCRCLPSAKVLALDADGVLWGDVLAEVGFDGISTGSNDADRTFRSFQQTVLRMKKRGVLLAIVSRNELTDVLKVFETHPDMLLRPDDVAAWRVNWQPKSQNLKEIAAELNVGLDSFVFVDNDPANQLEVRACAPEVLVLPLPPNPDDNAPLLERLWCFDSVTSTEADSLRTEMIRQEPVRRKQRDEAIDLSSYLSSLELRVVMRASTPADVLRVAQLTQKTNQFNLSLKRRSEAEVRSLPHGYATYVIEAADRFGDYGLVGVCILYRPSDQPERVELDTLLISCRALGRGIEDATLYGLLELVRSSGSGCLEAELVVGPRNQPVADFLRRGEFTQSQPGRYILPADRGCSIPSHIA